MVRVCHHLKETTISKMVATTSRGLTIAFTWTCKQKSDDLPHTLAKDYANFKHTRNGLVPKRTNILDLLVYDAITMRMEKTSKNIIPNKWWVFHGDFHPIEDRIRNKNQPEKTTKSEVFTTISWEYPRPTNSGL